MTVIQNTNTANSAEHATANNEAAKPVTSYLSNLFKRGPGKAAVDSKLIAKAAGAGNASQAQIAIEIDALEDAYAQYKRDIGDRSDTGLWQVQQSVYVNVLSIDGDGVNGALRKEALVKELKERGYKKASVKDSTASLLVKCVFADQAKQTHSNYVQMMKKAQALKIAGDELAAFLKKYGGYMKVLETYFAVDEQGAVTTVDTAPVSVDAEEAKAQAQEQMKAFRRALIAMSGDVVDEVACAGVTDWVPVDERKEATKAKDPDNAKYKRGSFVFFVAVEGDVPGKYKLVQGFSAARDLEDKLMAQLLPNIEATTEELRAVAQNYEQAQGLFDDSEGTAI